MDEDKQSLPRMLTGEELVRQGRFAKETPLPEVGLKEVTPDGSWLEAQRIKAALEARKALLAVERIDKIGSLSHAEWRDNLRLAEVTKQVGGYWQYIGHKVNHTMYLRPEEALYLIETNCLLLRHNSVTVSFQKAHKLLLDDTMPLTKYKVYASLSRVGYKVLKHDKRVLSKSTDVDYEMLEKHKHAKDKESTSHEEIEDASYINKPKIDNVNENITGTSNDNDGEENKNSTMLSDDINVKKSSTDFVMCNQQNEPKESSISMDIDQNGNENIPELLTNSLEIEKTAVIQSKAAFTIDEHGVIRVNDIGDCLTTIETNTKIDKNITSNTDSSATEKRTKSTSYSQHMINCFKAKYQKILNRKFKPLDSKSFHEKFKNIPDFSAHQIATIKVPSEEYLPRNIFLNNTTYVLNLETLRAKSRRSSLSSVSTTSSPCLRIRNSRSVSPRMHSRPTQTPQFSPRVNIFPRGPRPHQPASQFRTRFEFPNMFQRPEFINFLPMYRFNQFYQNNTNFMYRPRFVNTQNPPSYVEARKRQYQNMKTSHLNEIKDCARRLKHFSSPPEESVISLKNLLIRFNEIYQEKMILDSDFDIVDSQYEIQTIELDDDDDEEVPRKQRKEDETFNEYLKNIKELAATLKRIERNGQSTSKQKRAFCNLIRNFNSAYGTDYNLDSTGEVIDRKLVVLDSSSDSDVVIEDYAKTKKRKHKMVRNPFHNMKKQKMNIASTSKANDNVQPTDENPTHMELGLESIVEDNSKEQVEPRDRLKNFFDEKWLPSEQDFGKALPCSKADAQLLDIIRFDTDIVENNWSEAKIKACYRMESHLHFYKGSELDHDVTIVNSSSTPLIGTDDDKFNDSYKVWENLRIISSNTDIKDTELRIDFDVYNRDVQNFRKTDPPVPHFRIVCVDESSPFPSGAEVRALHSNYSDNVSIVFAVVGIGSISYLQVNPTELPLFVGSE